jgi:17beta-estradiol 17-dehydrogenase / very-long-chain 3-oxoacyl-CoA reductase
VDLLSHLNIIKLCNSWQYVENRHHVETRIIDVDFTKETEIYDRIARDINGLEIGVLINNVGMSYKYPEYLDQVRKIKFFK